jgi:hypothetical protein
LLITIAEIRNELADMIGKNVFCMLFTLVVQPEQSRDLMCFISMCPHFILAAPHDVAESK